MQLSACVCVCVVRGFERKCSSSVESQLRGDCTDSGSGPLLAGQNWPQQPLVAGPSLRSAHANKEALAYSWFVFQRGILQISSHRAPRSHVPRPGYRGSGGAPCWRGCWSPRSPVARLFLTPFQRRALAEATRVQIYNEDESHANNLQSF